MSKRRDLDRLADMREAVKDTKTLTADGKETFEQDRVAQQAVAYSLAVLGEAAPVLSPELRDRRAHPSTGKLGGYVLGIAKDGDTLYSLQAPKQPGVESGPGCSTALPCDEPTICV